MKIILLTMTTSLQLDTQATSLVPGRFYYYQVPLYDINLITTFTTHHFAVTSLLLLMCYVITTFFLNSIYHYYTITVTTFRLQHSFYILLRLPYHFCYIITTSPLLHHHYTKNTLLKLCQCALTSFKFIITAA